MAKLGYLVDFRNPPGSGRDFASLYRDLFGQIELADEGGLDSVWVTEHHLTDDGYLGAVTPMLAAIAARTKHVSIGTFVLLAPFYHPLRLAEDTATIDVLSGGRLRLGIGTGYRVEELEAFGIPRNERLSRTLETIEILKRAWTGEPFDFEGKHFRFRDARVLPRPVSRPHPQLLWGGMTRRAIERGAELGLSFACNLGKREAALYRETLQRLGKDPQAYDIVSSRIVYVADDADRAWAEIEAGATYQAAVYDQWFARASGGKRGWVLADAQALRKTCVLGSPAEVREQLSAILAASPMTEMILVMQLPGVEPARALRSLERFLAEVLPALR
jgi:alkanesulfonate monooxygenase SsuD/methylene tetrahydromethanopterin reductase-like flavin-dependent oxidoreductase (luciferase family)